MIDIVALSGRPKNKLVQLAQPLEKVKLEKIQWPQLVSEKIDGVFCLAIKHQGEVGIFSRTGEQYTSMKHLEEIFMETLDEDQIIIFEACHALETPQSVVSGWCRDTKEQHPELKAACHDIISLDEFINGGKRRYRARQRYLRTKTRSVAPQEITHVSYISVVLVWSLQEAQAYADTIISLGGEGAVLRNPEGLYQGGKRNQDIIKLKKGVSFDLKVLEVKRGKGKYADTLGTLVCKWKDGKTIEISGMTDNERDLWWNDPCFIVGSIVQVDAMCESSKGLLREPRFKGIRFDKTEGDF
jgi:DNA ligase-1